VKLRTFLFWSHLVAAVITGLVVLVMCVTGALLTFERQLLEWTDRGFQSVPTAGATPLSLVALEARVVEQVPGFEATAITLRQGHLSPVSVVAGRRTLYLDQYSGAVLGEPSRGGLRGALASLRSWHRWLGIEGPWRPVAKALTGWSNLFFAALVLTGVYLWWPARWTVRHLRPVIWFRGGLQGKARDFNWHNVVGLWSAVPLLIVILGAVPISFSWGGALLYRLVGETPPVEGRGEGPPQPRREPRPERAERPGRPSAGMLRAAEQGLRQVAAGTDGWRSIAIRWPRSPRAPVVLTVDRGSGGQPQYRSTVEVSATTGAVLKTEALSDQSRGRQLRSLARFAHTGEVLGLPGQTVAGLVSAGGALLVWTGYALAWRRLTAWIRRRRKSTATAPASLDHAPVRRRA